MLFNTTMWTAFRPHANLIHRAYKWNESNPLLRRYNLFESRELINKTV